jgi:hypothetical protein
MTNISVAYKDISIKDMNRTGDTASIKLELPLTASMDDLFLVKNNGLIAFVVNGVEVPVKLHSTNGVKEKHARIFVQMKTLRAYAVTTDSMIDAVLEIRYSLDTPLFPNMDDPFAKPAKGKKDNSDSETRTIDFSGIDERSEAQRLADEQKVADLEMDKPKKRGSRKGFNNGGEARA